MTVVQAFGQKKEREKRGRRKQGLGQRRMGIDHF